jgi:ethanolamine ammonia-lyase small subunit
MAEPPALGYLLAAMRARTQARIAIGRIGHALPTGAMLDFASAHARARDAVHSPLETEGFSTAIGGRAVIEVASRATDRATYLQRPDLGRRLGEGTSIEKGRSDVAFVVADGLSATAIHAHAAGLLNALFARLDGWAIAPIIVARHARVALGDEIGALLGARMVVVLIGERPGLSAPDSLGAYLTWEPRIGRVDSERNCVSNIRPPHGLGYDEAAETIVRLMTLARRRGGSGVALKDDGTEPPGIGGEAPAAGP